MSSEVAGEVASIMWDQRLRVVKPAKVQDPYAPGKSSRVTLDIKQGAEIADGAFLVECQPISLVENTDSGTREAVETAWRIISRRGQPITNIKSSDGVLVDGIDGVLQVVGEVGQWPSPSRLAHTEFTVKRWLG